MHAVGVTAEQNLTRTSMASVANRVIESGKLQPRSMEQRLSQGQGRAALRRDEVIVIKLWLSCADLFTAHESLSRYVQRRRMNFSVPGGVGAAMAAAAASSSSTAAAAAVESGTNNGSQVAGGYGGEAGLLELAQLAAQRQKLLETAPVPHPMRRGED